MVLYTIPLQSVFVRRRKRYGSYHCHQRTSSIALADRNGRTNLSPGRAIFVSTLVPGSGSFQLPPSSLYGGFGLWVRVRVLGSVYHHRFPNTNPNLNHTN